VAQGYEAGGHRGSFDPDANDDRLGTFVLTRLLARELEIPIIAAGGIMDGAEISAVLRLGAMAAQMGTAFIPCPESVADAGYRAASRERRGEPHRHDTRVFGATRAASRQSLHGVGSAIPAREIPIYPIAYDAGKMLNAAGVLVGEPGFGAQWADQGAPLARSLPAAELIAVLANELKAA
jgi:nitronate monooxygenase